MDTAPNCHYEIRCHLAIKTKSDKFYAFESHVHINACTWHSTVQHNTRVCIVRVYGIYCSTVKPVRLHISQLCTL